MITHYSNEFGAVTFKPVTDSIHVSTIHGKNLDPSVMFDIETAEKIALITDNRRIQLAPFKTPTGWRMYVVLHETASMAAVAVVESLDYRGGNPRAEIQAAQRPMVYL